ncbi:MAG: hypothetical protein Q7W16_09645, partial [Coriobacteriia bacterium]|nr:hypothetical protein [Coriobacteriia bacterium]
MLGFVSVVLGTGQPPRCTRCHGAAQVAEYRAASDVVADISTAAQSWAAGPGPNLTLDGPEPFGHPELPSIVAGAAAAGVARLRLDSDATALVSPANASGSIAA